MKLKKIVSPLVRLSGRLLVHRSLLVILPLLTLLLALPALAAGLFSDDLVHRYRLMHGDSVTAAGAAMNLFRFIPDQQTVSAGMAIGLLPWWTAPDLRLNFWRPLTSLSHWLDYQLWPAAPVMMHVHSLLWAAVMVLLAALLYRRLLGASLPAGLAALMFALDDAHGFPIAFIANRNAVMATVFGFATLLAHNAWRRGRSPRAGVLAALAFAAALLCGEFGAGTGAYLVAYALCLEPATSRRARWVSLTPYLAIGLVWVIALKVMGFGVSGSGAYFDPFADPLHFVRSLAFSVPMLLQSQWGGLSAHVSIFLAVPLRMGFIALSIACLLLLALIFLPSMRRSAPARFFAVGMLLALIPLAGTRPSDRLLLLVGFGAFGLLAVCLTDLLGHSAEAPGSKRRWPTRAKAALAIVLLLIHIPVAAVMNPVHILTLNGANRHIEKLALAFSADPSIANRQLVLIASRSPFRDAMIPLQREAAGLAMPGSLFILANAVSEMMLTRTDLNTLRVAPRGGFLLPPGTLDEDHPPLVSQRYARQSSDRIYRPPDRPFQTGEWIQAGETKIHIVETTPDQRPAVVDFQFNQPLEDPSHLWFTYKARDYIPWVPPAVGQSMTIPAGEFGD